MPSLKKRKISHEDAGALSDPESPASAVSQPGQSPEDTAAQTEEPQSAPKSFKDLGVIDPLCEACEAMGYKAPTPIQAESIPLVPLP
jgi:ATP-dependent RNA helicase DDX47/RRP3